jgi:THO complex subunit 3
MAELFDEAKYSQYLADTKQHFQKNSTIKDFQAHESKAHSVGWSCDGRKLASGSTDKTVSVFSLEKFNLTRIHNYKGHTDHVDQLAWHPSHPDYLVSASEDKTVRIWDSRTTKCAQCINTKGDNINICWSPDGNTVAVGNKEDLITWIDTRTYKMRAELQFSYEVNEISWNKANDLFFLTNGHGCVCILRCWW